VPERAAVPEEGCTTGDAGEEEPAERAAKEETNENRCCFVGWHEHIAALWP
jgi:hypothetical protein